MPKKQTQPPITIVYHPDAAAELLSADKEMVADVVAVVNKLNGKTHQELVALLDGRSERKVCQWERSNRGGALRVVFAWGAGCLWYIGAFVKINDAHGERLMKQILPRALEVEKKGIPK